jgi:uncharacterized protein YndB with AHSA1/START domain
MTTDTQPQLSLTRIVDAPRARVFRAFTVAEEFAAWWGPHGNVLHDVELDVRAGGTMRWSEGFPDEPAIWTHGRIDLTEVVDGELLDGVMRIAGELPGGYEPFETRMRVEFHDETGGRTRLEIRQWLPEGYAAPTEEGWGEALAKLDALLAT